MLQGRRCQTPVWCSNFVDWLATVQEYRVARDTKLLKLYPQKRSCLLPFTEGLTQIFSRTLRTLLTLNNIKNKFRFSRGYTETVNSAVWCYLGEGMSTFLPPSPTHSLTWFIYTHCKATYYLYMLN